MFVLGAAASVPLGMPTTKSLLQKLENKTRLGRLAAEIHKSAAYRFRIGVDDVNIEDFFEYLYELQLMIWFAQRSELPTLLPGFTARATVTDIARKDLSAIQLNVDRLLHRTCGDCSGAKVDALWRPILEFVSGQQPVVPIFTLNYDWTFEKLAIEKPQRYHLTDGFELLGGNWDAERFAKMRPARKKINLALFKLHGSTCWLGGMKSMGRFEARTRDGGGDDYPSRPFDMVYPGHAHEMSLGKEYWDRASDPSGTQWPWLEQDPYKTLYRRHRLCLPRQAREPRDHQGQPARESYRGRPRHRALRQENGHHPDGPAVRMAEIQRGRHALVTVLFSRRKVRSAVDRANAARRDTGPAGAPVLPRRKALKSPPAQLSKKK
ncbi:MAG: hypothetical protein DMF89_06020 [Acidobacteria bacterium]|nr:MAG: hypothetical protein DMF89_06020 [Acidobacteriota bacterium]